MKRFLAVMVLALPGCVNLQPAANYIEGHRQLAVDDVLAIARETSEDSPARPLLERLHWRLTDRMAPWTSELQRYAGETVVHIAKDKQLVVRIFVPEAQIHRITKGQRVFAVSLGSEKRIAATVSKIERFPQEMGFLLHDNSLPNARDKAFAVTADLGKGAKGLSAGNEVRVQLDQP